MQIGPAVLRGERLPVPERSRLLGPSPSCATTFSRYLQLMTKCTERQPHLRPSFSEIADELGKLLADEVSASASAAASGPGTAAPPGGAQDGSSLNLCVICMERPCNAGLVHAAEEMIHRCCCHECAVDLRESGMPCPLCRLPFVVMKLF